MATIQLSGGKATLTLSATTELAIGTHSITGIYSGDANNSGATSPVLTQTVNKIASSLTLTSSVNPSTVGQAITFTVKVTPSSATGTVSLLDGLTPLGSPTLSGGTATLIVNAPGVPAQLAAGLHVITAIYAGDTNTAASLPAILAQTVNPGTTNINIQ